MSQRDVSVREDLSQFACPNPACAYYGMLLEKGGKLWADQRMGKEGEHKLEGHTLKKIAFVQA